MQKILNELKVFGQIQGILFDLGVSSPQLDDDKRGFSFMREGTLDMRMDRSQDIDAKTLIQHSKEEDLAHIFWEYGEERFSRQIAKAIITARAEKPITTTQSLADIIKQAIPASKRSHDKHPATRCFLALRIAINHELSELEQGLKQALDALTHGGRLGIISFHSLEDRIVKQFIHHHEKGDQPPRGLPIKGKIFNAKLKSIHKPIKPNEQEIRNNPRARSAILRIAEKLS